MSDKALGGVFNSSGGIDVGGAPAITTQGQITFLGSFSGNNSIPIGQIGSSLFASTLLGQREKFDDYSIFFGGFIEADAQTWFGSSNTAENNSLSATGENIYLTSAKLYFLANVGHYVTLQFDFDTDETGGFGLGNLDTSPFFVTVGRNKISVGSYGGGPWTSGMTDWLAPNKVTNVSVNYKSQVWNANVSVFGTDDQTADFSTAVFYADSWTENLIGAFNVGYVYNMVGAANYSMVLGGRNTSFGVSYGQSYNAADVPMTISASAVNGPKSTSGIKQQLIISGNRAYFDNNVLFGPEYSYQKLYNGKHMNTITLDMSIYV